MAQGTPSEARMVAAGVEPGMTPLDAWRRLRAVEGSRTSIIDLYELVARPRELAGHQLPMAERHRLARLVMSDVWPGWAVTEGSERSGDLIEIVDYDPAWPALFLAWRAVVHTALGDAAVRVEHVGSTSVPGMAAKPTIDMQVSVPDLADEAAYVDPLAGVGLQLRSRDDLHRYFRPWPGRPREIHVHVCQVGSEWEEEHLRFRDYLRTDANAREAYARVKRDAALLWADDGLAYTDAKTEIILRILGQATGDSAVRSAE